MEDELRRLSRAIEELKLPIINDLTIEKSIDRLRDEPRTIENTLREISKPVDLKTMDQETTKSIGFSSIQLTKEFKDLLKKKKGSLSYEQFIKRLLKL